MPNVLLPILPGQMPSQYCFTDWQTLLVDLSNAQKAVLQAGMAFYNYGDTVPAPEYQAYPWLRTTDMRWYRYDGDWISPNPCQDANERRIYIGDLTALKTYDGGNGVIEPLVGPRSGAMWEEDTDFIGRVPIGVGAIPGSATPAITTTVGGTTGAAEHTLTEAEGAVGQHIHPFGVSNAGGDDAFFARSGVNTVTAYTGFYITGNGPNTVMGETTADLFTLPSGLGGAGVTPTPFQTIPPAKAVYVIKRTARIYYKV